MTNASPWTGLDWRKSSYSADNGACVEVVGTIGAIRDSKNPTGPILRADLTTFITTVKSGEVGR